MKASDHPNPVRFRGLPRHATAGQALLLLAAATVFAGQPNVEPGDLADELIAIWAPPPNWRDRLGWPGTEVWDICSYRSPWVPSDDAPPDLLVGFWSWAPCFVEVSEPSLRVCERLLVEIEKDPTLLPDLFYAVNRAQSCSERAQDLLRRTRESLSEYERPRFDWRMKNRREPRFRKDVQSRDAKELTPEKNDRFGRFLFSDRSTEAELDLILKEFCKDKDPRNIRVLRNLLTAESLGAEARRNATQAILDWEDIALEEVIDCFDALARKRATEGFRFQPDLYLDDLLDDDEELAPALGKGIRLFFCGPLDDDIASLVLDRADSIRAFAPKVARELETILADWPLEPVEQRLLVNVLRGNAAASVVHELLKKRERLRGSAPRELMALCSSSGFSKGIGEALHADPASVAEVLDGTDDDARRVLLACLRLIRHPLPLAKVKMLLDSSNDRLSRAAQYYLESEGSFEAREMVWQRRPCDVRIVGTRMERPPGHINFSRLDAAEAKLQREMRDVGGPDEIFALIGGGWDAVVHSRIVRIRGTEVLYARERKGQVVATRVLSERDWKNLRYLVGSKALDDLPPLTSRIFDGVQWEYVHLTRRGGSRVFMHCPGAESGTRGTVYDRIVLAFRALDERQ